MRSTSPRQSRGRRRRHRPLDISSARSAAFSTVASFPRVLRTFGQGHPLERGSKAHAAIGYSPGRRRALVPDLPHDDRADAGARVRARESLAQRVGPPLQRPRREEGGRQARARGRVGVRRRPWRRRPAPGLLDEPQSVPALPPARPADELVVGDLVGRCPLPDRDRLPDALQDTAASSRTCETWMPPSPRHPGEGDHLVRPGEDARNVEEAVLSPAPRRSSPRGRAPACGRSRRRTAPGPPGEDGLADGAVATGLASSPRSARSTSRGTPRAKGRRAVRLRPGS